MKHSTTYRGPAASFVALTTQSGRCLTARAGREPSQSSLSRPSGGCRYRGPAPSFIALTRNPALDSPARFEPTVKREGDIVI
jgi:hypothetical protein